VSKSGDAKDADGLLDFNTGLAAWDPSLTAGDPKKFENFLLSTKFY
jgi:hypothetical protein